MAMFGDISIRGLLVTKVSVSDKRCWLGMIASYNNPQTETYSEQKFELTIFPERGKSSIHRFTLADFERIKGEMNLGRRVFVNVMSAFSGAISSYVKKDGTIEELKEPLVQLTGGKVIIMDKAGYEINKNCYRKLKPQNLDYNKYEKAVVQSDKESL